MRIPSTSVAAVFVCVAFVASGCASGQQPGASSSASTPRVSTSASSASAAVTLASAAPSLLESPVPTATVSPYATVSPSASSSSLAIPADFEPSSVTFVSPTAGFVLGSGSCGDATCTMLVATHDAGRTWSFVATVPAKIGDEGGVRKVRFADPRDGWIFGPTLWSTHDGGHTWRQIAEPAAVSDVEAGGGEVYAAIGSHVLRSSVSSDSFATLSISVGSGAASIAPHGHAVWIVGGAAPGQSKVFYSADGTSWTTLPDPCAAWPDFAAVAVAPVSDSEIYLLCGGNPGAGSESKKVLYSTDSGARATPTKADPPRGGDINGFAAASPSVVAIAAASGASEVYRSGDSGATWTTPLSQGDGGVGYHDLGFTTPTQGVAVYGNVGQSPTSLLMTRDAGATWVPVTF